MSSQLTCQPMRTCVFILLLLLSMATSGFASQDRPDETTAADVKAEVMETYEVLKDYTIEQRDDAMAAAEEKMAQLDARISEMQSKVDDQWQDMSMATREQTRKTLETLRKKREEIAEWYGGMRYSTREAWEEVKKGFAESYDRLERAFTRARKDFERGEK